MPKVSVIIPTLNEVENIEKVLREIPKDRVDEILVIDGHSTDGTVELVKKLGYPLIFQPSKGFGEAFSTGVKEAKSDVIVFINADNSHDPADIPKLLAKIEEGYDMVMASRYSPGAGSDDDTLLHYIGNKIFTFLSNKIHKANFSDILYFFLAIRREVFDKVKTSSSGFEYCIELPIKVHKAGFKIAQIPSFERKRSGGQAKVNAFSVGLKILLAILKY